MAYSNQFISLRWLFRIIGTDEIAVTGLNYSTAPGWTGAVAALGEMSAGATAPALVNRMATLMGTAQIQWAEYSRLVGIKCAAVGTDGHYLTDPLIFEDDTPAAGASLQTLPQGAIVVSLLSGFTLGAGNRGRMYLPHCHAGIVAGSAQSDDATVAFIATAAGTFINGCTDDINADTTATLFPAIMSQKGAGTAKGVTSVAVGTVNDTQRRRRNALIESYVTDAL
jgi:hypothetical protein